MCMEKFIQINLVLSNCFEETHSTHLLKVGLIVLKKGLYILLVPDALGVYRNGHVKCGKGNFEILNSNANKHLYFSKIYGDY